MTFVLEDLLRPGCALFLDFDGTLVELAPRPQDVRVPAALGAALTALAGRLGGALALVSGRPIAELDALLAPLRLPAAGIHGAERRGADGALHRLPAPDLRHVSAAARALVARHPGLRLELKPGALALHYRQAPELAALCLSTLRAAVALTPGLALQPGKEVVEARPASASKGLAVEAFLREAPFAGRWPLFVGDDLSDEAGFSTAQRLGGLGVKVGAGPSIARHRLGSVAALRRALLGRAAPRPAATRATATSPGSALGPPAP